MAAASWQALPTELDKRTLASKWLVAAIEQGSTSDFVDHRDLIQQYTSLPISLLASLEHLGAELEFHFPEIEYWPLMVDGVSRVRYCGLRWREPHDAIVDVELSKLIIEAWLAEVLVLVPPASPGLILVEYSDLGRTWAARRAAWRLLDRQVPDIFEILFQMTAALVQWDARRRRLPGVALIPGGLHRSGYLRLLNAFLIADLNELPDGRERWPDYERAVFERAMVEATAPAESLEPSSARLTLPAILTDPSTPVETKRLHRVRVHGSLQAEAAVFYPRTPEYPATSSEPVTGFNAKLTTSLIMCIGTGLESEPAFGTRAAVVNDMQATFSGQGSGGSSRTPLFINGVLFEQADGTVVPCRKIEHRCSSIKICPLNREAAQASTLPRLEQVAARSEAMREATARDHPETIEGLTRRYFSLLQSLKCHALIRNGEPCKPRWKIVKRQMTGSTLESQQFYVQCQGPVDSALYNTKSGPLHHRSVELPYGVDLDLLRSFISPHEAGAALLQSAISTATADSCPFMVSGGSHMTRCPFTHTLPLPSASLGASSAPSSDSAASGALEGLTLGASPPSALASVLGPEPVAAHAAVGRLPLLRPPCKAKVIIYEPLSSEQWTSVHNTAPAGVQIRVRPRGVLVQIRGEHRHAASPLSSTPLHVQQQLGQVVAPGLGQVVRPMRADALKFAPIVRSQLGGASLPQVHPTLGSVSLLHQAVNNALVSNLSPRMGFNDIVTLFHAHEFRKEVHDRYIQHAGQLKIVNDPRPHFHIHFAHPELLMMMSQSRYLVSDTTFKNLASRDHLTLRIAGWNQREGRAIAGYRVVYTSKTGASHLNIWTSYASVYREVTGRPFGFIGLGNGTHSGLVCDFELAPIQQLATVMARTCSLALQQRIAGLSDRDIQEILLPLFIILCEVHWKRGVLGIRFDLHVRHERSLHFRLHNIARASPAEVQLIEAELDSGFYCIEAGPGAGAAPAACIPLPAKVRNWWLNKTPPRHWLFKCLVISMSPLPPGQRATAVPHSNLVEGAHALSNAHIGIGWQSVGEYGAASRGEDQAIAEVLLSNRHHGIAHSHTGNSVHSRDVAAAARAKLRHDAAFTKRIAASAPLQAAYDVSLRLQKLALAFHGTPAEAQALNEAIELAERAVDTQLRQEGSPTKKARRSAASASTVAAPTVALASAAEPEAPGASALGGHR